MILAIDVLFFFAFILRYKILILFFNIFICRQFELGSYAKILL